MQARIGPVNAKIRTVASNSVGIGAVLRDGPAGLVEKDSSDTTYPGTYLALATGTGERRVLYWGSGWARNDAWSWTPGQALYLSATPGEMTQVDTGGTPVGIAESATEIYFGQVHPTYVGTAPAVVTITHTGQTFQPRATLDTATYPTATIEWAYSDETTSTDALPTEKDFVTSATRQTVCTVTPASALTSLNVGYQYDLDGAVWPVEHDLAAQAVSAITGLQSAVGLQVIAAVNPSGSANPNTMTTVDLSGLSALATAEFYGNDLETISALPSSVVRFCAELNALTALDATACSPVIEDLRSAQQVAGSLTTLTFASAGAPHLWHLCANRNSLTSLPDMTRFPALRDLLVEENDIAGTITLSGGNLGTARLYGNQITTLNAAGGYRTTGLSGSLDVHANPLTSLDISSNAYLGTIDASDCALNEAAADLVLSDLVANGNTGYGSLTLDVSDNVAPSAAGEASIVTLEGMGWTVTSDAGAPEPTAPVLVPASCVPADGAADVVVSSNITVMFDQAISAGTGDFRLYDSGGLVETFAVGAGTIDGNGITFSPASDMDPSEDCYTLWDADVVTGTVGGIGCAANADQTAHNWTTAAAPSAALWDDQFDGTIGDWVSTGTPTVSGTVSGGQLTFSGSTGYARFTNPTDVVLPADHRITVTVPHAQLSQAYWGPIGRSVPGAADVGVRLFFGSNCTAITLGSANTYNGGNVTIDTAGGSTPASWDPNAASQDHIIEMVFVGTSVSIYLDETYYGVGTVSINNTTGTGVGFCGELVLGAKSINSITVEAAE